jgi:hypothetical protein
MSRFSLDRPATAGYGWVSFPPREGSPMLITLQLLALFSAPDADPLEAAFAARRAKYRTLDVTVRSTEFTVTGGYGRNDRGDGLPKDDQTVETVHRLVIDGDKLRAESERLNWDAKGNVYHQPVLMVAAGGSTRMLFPSGDWPAEKPVGALLAPGEMPRTVGPNLRPILDHYRGTHTPLGRLAPTGRREKIGQNDCVEYTSLGRTGGTKYWFDPVADFSLVRQSQTIQDRPSRTVDIESTAEGPVCWVDTVFDRTGKVERKLTATVVAAKRNEPVPAERFVLPFPPGTYVQDESGDPAVRPTKYVIAADGTEVPVEDEPAEDEPVAEPPEPIDWMPPAITGGGLVAGLVGLLVWSRRRVRG